MPSNGGGASRVRRGVKRFLALFAVALVLGAITGAAAQAAKTPRYQAQARVWQRACLRAGGQVSPQPALVCTHSGFPMWSSGPLDTLRQVCEGRLGGSFVYRSQYPTELASCFFD